MAPRLVVFFYFILLLVYMIKSASCQHGFRAASQKRMFNITESSILLSESSSQLLVGFLQEMLYKCHVTIVAQHIPKSLPTKLNQIGIPSVLLSPYNGMAESDKMLSQLQMRDPQFPCNSVVVDLHPDQNLSLEFLEKVSIWRQPHTYIVLLGSATQRASRPQAVEAFRHHSLRNSANVIYLALTSSEIPMEHHETVKVYNRCLYCRKRHAGLVLVDTWTSKNKSFNYQAWFPDQFKNMNGYQFKITSLLWDPFTTYNLAFEGAPAGSIITLTDSVDVRMLNTLAQNYNFTYVAREPVDREWGRMKADGKNFSGLIGDLQFYVADFSLISGITPQRIFYCDFTMIYAYEGIQIIAPQPELLPLYLSIIRPFSAVLWSGIIVSCAIVGFIIWGIQLAYSKLIGTKSQALQDSIFVAWGTLLEDIPPKHQQPQNTSAQMIIGWWLLFCMIVTALYRAALLGILALPEKYEPMDTMEKIVANSDVWTWGMEPIYDTAWEWFRTSTQPTLQAIFHGTGVYEQPEHRERLEKGNYALITWRSSFRNHPYFETPIHEFQYGFAWGVRKGAPFLVSFDTMIQRLVETGIVNFWIEQTWYNTQKKVLNADIKPWFSGSTKALSRPESAGASEGSFALSMSHLQGSFYLLFLGSIFAFMSLLVELTTYHMIK